MGHSASQEHTLGKLTIWEDSRITIKVQTRGSPYRIPASLFNFLLFEQFIMYSSSTACDTHTTLSS